MALRADNYTQADKRAGKVDHGWKTKEKKEKSSKWQQGKAEHRASGAWQKATSRREHPDHPGFETPERTRTADTEPKKKLKTMGDPNNPIIL